MEKVRPILEYLESINPAAEFILSGNVGAKDTPLDYLNTFGKVSKIDFHVSFKKVSDIILIDPTWLEETGVTFTTIGWTGRIEQHISTVHIYLTMPIPSIYIKTDSQPFAYRIEEFSQQLGFRVFNRG